MLWLALALFGHIVGLALKRTYANGLGNTVNSSPVQLAKREVHDFFGNRIAWVSTLAAGILIGVAGPFDTDDVMRLLPRIAYWTTLAVLTFLTGSIINAICSPLFHPRLPQWLGLPIIAAITAVAITAEIFGLNALIFGFVPTTLGLAILFGNVFFVSLVISAALGFVSQDQSEQVDDKVTTDAPRLLQRLPLAKRGALISISAVDHYVEVKTDQGTELVLMRLSDAISEATPTAGLQVHRSHWVAHAHVVDVARSSRKATLTLSNGHSIPVSRTYLPLLKEAGLLPV